MLTLKKVNDVLKKNGHNAELVRGNGYLYFSGDDAYSFHDSIVGGVYRLNELTLEEWILAFEEKKNG